MAAAVCSPTAHQTGHITSTCTTDPHSDTTSFTVPTDCDCLVIGVSSYSSLWDTTSPIVTIKWDTTTLTKAIELIDTQADYLNGLYYLVSPTTGNQTLEIDWNFSGGSPEEPIGVTAFYLKGIDSGTPLGSTDTAYVTTGSATTSVTGTNAVDIAVCMAYNWDTTPAGWDGTETVLEAITNQTGSGTCSSHTSFGSAYDTSGSPFTFSVGSGSNEASLSTAVFKGTAGVTIEVPNGPVW